MVAVGFTHPLSLISCITLGINSPSEGFDEVFDVPFVPGPFKTQAQMERFFQFME